MFLTQSIGSAFPSCTNSDDTVSQQVINGRMFDKGKIQHCIRMTLTSTKHTQREVGTNIERAALPRIANPCKPASSKKAHFDCDVPTPTQSDGKAHSELFL
eukprot:scaffold1221_cov207-Amphora_coffeaeformis.AAC.36